MSEPGPEVGGLRLAVTSNGDTHFGTKSLGWIRVAGKNMFVVVPALLISLRVLNCRIRNGLFLCWKAECGDSSGHGTGDRRRRAVESEAASQL